MPKKKGRRVKDVKAIGEFIIAFSQLEYVIRATFERMMGLASQRADIILANYDFAALCNAAKAFARTLPDRDERALRSFDELISECLRINTQRVRVVHGTWMGAGGARHFSRQSFKSAEYFASYEEMMALIDAAGKAFDEFCTILLDKDQKWGPIVKYLHDEQTIDI